MVECNHQCNSCAKTCTDRTEKNLLVMPHPESSIKKIIGVISGKGGVGKSLVTSMMAVELNRRGYRTGILDADITGPSIGKMFGVKTKASGSETTIYPHKTVSGIQLISVNMLLENDEEPVLWRGPIIAGMVKQFYSDVLWEDIDYLVVDMPPGTGDVPLTVFQSLPIDGCIMVTSPQELVKMVVGKAVSMAKMMNVPIIGMIENMSYIQCDECSKILYPFGEGKTEAAAKEYGVDFLGKLPLNPMFSILSDQGNFEQVETKEIKEVVDKISGKISSD
ncbi:MAG: Mrp/NBP35 family ATP-binding protein [Anaerorhabdus sp.]